MKILLLFALVALVSVIPNSSFALEENGLIDLPFTENPPIIDGKWSTADEWTDASQTTVSNVNDAMILLVKSDRNFIYIMADITSDFYQEKDVNYALGLYFDTDNTGENLREKDDLRFVYGKSSLILTDKCLKCIDSPSARKGFNTNTLSCESGTTLKSDVSDASAKKGNWISIETEARKQQLVDVSVEFKPALTCEKYSTPSIPTGEGINFIDFGSSTSDTAKMNTPNGFDYKIGFSSKNDPFESGRDHRTYELKIPIEFLHKSNSYGFGVMYWIKDSEFSTIMWPSGLNWEIPSTYGSLISTDGAVTAPPVPFMSVSTKLFDFGNVEVSTKSTKSFNIKNTGTGLLKIESVRSFGEYAVDETKTSIDLEPNQSITFNVSFNPLSIGTKSGSITISSNDLSNPTYTIQLSGKGTEKGGCLIATATYGSELAPQVQQLRELRDNSLLQTESGTSFMTGFNQFYYSFSPTIADWERENPVFKEAVKIAITPMLSTLSIMTLADSEAEVLGLGISVIALNLGMYFVAPLFVTSQIIKKQRQHSSTKIQ